MRSLEAIGVLEKDDDKGGRRITQSGQRDLDRESCPSTRHVLPKTGRRWSRERDFIGEYVGIIRHLTDLSLQGSRYQRSKPTTTKTKSSKHKMATKELS